MKTLFNRTNAGQPAKEFTIMPERYVLQPSEIANHFVCTDTENKIVCVFENKKFNSTQKMTMLEGFNPDNFTKLARNMREMGDWLMQHHKEKL